MSGPDFTHFHSVDLEAQKKRFLEFLDRANSLDVPRRWKRRMLELLALAPGVQVLDVGCGLGDDSREIARAIQPGGQSVGVDASSFLISVAEERSRAQGVPVAFSLGDATRLDFPDNRFDAVRSERVLMHVDNPALAIAEMARVVKPGGRVVVFDFDWDLFSIDHADVEFSRAAVRVVGDSMKSGTVGRQLPRLFRGAYLTGVSIEGFVVIYEWDFFAVLFSGMWEKAVASGALEEQRYRRWWKDLEDAAKSNDFFAANAGFIVSGSKPESQ